MIIMIIYSAWTLQLWQGPVVNHTRVTELGLCETEAEGVRVVINNGLEGKVQIPQTDTFVFFLLLPIFQERPTSPSVS